MRIAIVDLSLPLTRQCPGIAALWLQHELTRYHATLVPPPEADVICATSVSAIEAPRLKRLRKQCPRAFIALGGGGTISPAAYGTAPDVICLGHGETFLPLLANDPPATLKLPNAWIPGDTRPVTIAPGAPWNCPPIQDSDGAYRIWLAHGCPRRCAFCPTGWAYTYEQTPDPELAIRTAASLHHRGLKISYITNDLALHPFADRLPPTLHASLSLAALRRGLPAAHQIRIGVEGVSERIRRAVGKPISNAELVDSAAWLCANKHSIRWFMIAGLPGETDDDWHELRNLLQQLKRRLTKGVVALSFTAFHHHPCTPLAGQPLDDTYWQRFRSFGSWFFDGPGFSPRIQIMNPQTPPHRLETTIATMALTETQLRTGGIPSPNTRILYPHRRLIAPALARYQKEMAQ